MSVPSSNSLSWLRHDLRSEPAGTPTASRLRKATDVARRVARSQGLVRQHGASAAGVLVLGCIGGDTAVGFEGTPRGLPEFAGGNAEGATQ